MKGTNMNEQPERQMEHVAKGIMQACEEMGSLTHDSVNAAIQSANAATRGCEEFNRNLGTMLQESLSRAISCGRTMASAKSLREMMETQAEFARACFDQWVASTTKLSEISARCTQEAFEPMTNHANAAISKMAQRAQPQGRGEHTERAA